MQLLRPLLMIGMLVITFFTVQRKRAAKWATSVESAEDSSTLIPLEQPTVVLIANLTHADWKMRLSAVQQLTPQADESLIPDFIKLLHDSDYDVREAAREGLERLGKNAVLGLIDTLQTGNTEARRLAVQALGMIDAEAAMPQLITALKDESMWVRTPAASALGKVNHPDAIAALTDALEDESEEVRDVATTALRQRNIRVIPKHIENTGE